MDLSEHAEIKNTWAGCIFRVKTGARVKEELGADYPEFVAELIYLNWIRGTIFALLSLFAFALIMLFDLHYYQADKWEVSIGYPILFYSHMSVFMLFTAGIGLSWMKRPEKTGRPSRYHQVLIAAFLWLAMLNLVAISIADVFINGSIAAYIGVVFSLAAIFIISNWFCLFLYLSNMAVMVYFVNVAAAYTGKDFGIQQINIITFTAFAVALSRLIYYAHIRDFKNRKLIKRQKHRLLELSVRDHLTNVLNRRSFAEISDMETARSKRHGGPLSLIIFDFDNFKCINDRFGHSAGDAVLIHSAELTQQNIRKTDTLFRWGGEEFIILSPETTLEDAAALADKLRLLIEAFVFPGGVKVTASFGVAQFAPGESIEDTVQRADKALYQAKGAGRNCVEKQPAHIFSC